MAQQLKSFAANGVQFAWDATSISAAETCLRKYYYQNLLGWTKIERSVHLVFGGHYASALEYFHKLCANGDDYDEAVLKTTQKMLIDTWDFEYDIDGNPKLDTGKPWESGDSNKTRETLLRSVIWYLEEFRNDSLVTLQLANGKPAVELSFSNQINDEIILCGHIDRMVMYGDEKMLTDNKTTKTTVTPKWFTDWTPDIQFSNYIFNGKIIFDKAIKGLVVDAAQVAVGFTRFSRGTIYRSKALLDEWFESTMETIAKAREATLRGRFPQNRTACGNYGGCEFREICSRLPEHRGSIFRTRYVKRKRWDPLERR